MSHARREIFPCFVIEIADGIDRAGWQFVVFKNRFPRTVGFFFIFRLCRTAGLIGRGTGELLAAEMKEYAPAHNYAH